MLAFDPENPFPLLKEEAHSYADAQRHSAQVDLWLGFSGELVEATIRHESYGSPLNDVQIWKDLPIQAMNTPYTEIRLILEELQLKPGSKILDLGCGYGRMAFVIGRHFPQLHFTGYEIVAERVIETNRVLKKFKYQNAGISVQDLSRDDFSPPSADCYFIFDFGSRSAVEKTLQDLRKHAAAQPICIVARGRGIRHAIYKSHPWLTQMHEPRTFRNFTIFRS